MHTVTGKLNDDARTHQSNAGTNFFVSIGEKNYNFKTKQAEWTNYDSAIFVKPERVEFMTGQLRKGAIVTVSGTGLIIDSYTNPTSGAVSMKLILQNSNLEYSNNELCGASQPAHAPQQQMAPQQQAPQYHQQAPPMQQAPQPMAPNGQPPYNGDVPY
jgi:single-stranded DNA-binding protein